MKNYGRTSLNAIFENRVLYRNLIPGDPNLPNLSQLRRQLEIPEGSTPRKTTQDYARVVHAILQEAQVARTSQRLKRVIMIGDTRMNDGTAFTNIAECGGWRGMAFIGSEDRSPESIQTEQVNACTLYTANRWSAMKAFDPLMMDQDFSVDESTVVLIDIDKTAIAARGRNHTVIDQARLDAAHITARDVLGEQADLCRFEKDYNLLNRPEYHNLTRDNQDVLVYICLILNCGWISTEGLLKGGATHEINHLDDFLTVAESAKPALPASTQQMHDNFKTLYQSGDPTPFKDFRQAEYLATLRRMGSHPDDTPIDRLLKEEIVLTAEVFHTALQWASQGALIFGLSDKPDEATNPLPDQAARGMKPIHEIETHMIGE